MLKKGAQKEKSGTPSHGVPKIQEVESPLSIKEESKNRFYHENSKSLTFNLNMSQADRKKMNASLFSKSGSKRSSRISRKMRKVKVTFDKKDDDIHEEDEEERPPQLPSIQEHNSPSQATNDVDQQLKQLQHFMNKHNEDDPQQFDVQSVTSSQYAAILNPNIKFVIEDLGEEVEEVEEVKEQSEYYEYGEEDEQGNTSFNVEVELANGKK